MITVYIATYIITQAAIQNTNSGESLPKQYIKNKITNVRSTANNVNSQVSNPHPNKKEE